MKDYSISEYILAGCKEMKGGMIAIHHVTGGRVCDTGCFAFNNGTCPAYQKLTGGNATKNLSIKELCRTCGIIVKGSIFKGEVSFICPRCNSHWQHKIKK